MRRTSRMLLAVSSTLAIACLIAPAAAAAAARPSQASTTTTTTLVSSSASVKRDSWVKLTATVSASGGVPAGAVTFIDKSNGSILDTAPLSNGTASLSTAALAPGSRSIVAHYGGSGAFAASRSAAVGIAVAQAGSPATAYQVDARHDGDQTRGTLHVASLAEKWSVTLGGTGAYGPAPVSYPLIARRRVFVTVEDTQGYGTELYALNAATGATDWSVGLGGLYYFSALTYDGRRIFALNFNGVLTAFAASTGHELWSVQMPGQYSFTAPPTAYDGVVYVSGAGSGGTVYAVSEADGVVRWTGSVANGDKSSPAVDDTGAYVSYACQQDYRFSLRGHLVWHYSTACDGGGGSTAVLHGSSLYARGAAADAPVILSTSSGSSTGSFAAHTAPAFGSTDMYTLQSGNLVAVDPSGSPDRWQFGDGTLVTAPVVSGGVVFTGSSNGTVYGVSARTGAKVWTGSAGTTILGPDEQNADILVGITVGGGLLVVPAGNVVTAFGD